MPTTKQRIQVTTDEALDRAISDAKRSWGRGMSRSRIVHDLALRGHGVRELDASATKAAVRRLVDWSTQDGAIDRTALTEAKNSWIPSR